MRASEISGDRASSGTTMGKHQFYAGSYDLKNAAALYFELRRKNIRCFDPMILQACTQRNCKFSLGAYKIQANA